MGFRSDMQKGIDQTYSQLGISPDPTQTLEETGIPMARPEYVSSEPIDVIAKAPTPKLPAGPSEMDIANKAISDALSAQQDALTAAGLAGQRMATKQAAEFNQAAKEQEQFAIDQAQRDQERQKQMEEQEKVVQQATEDYLSKSVDPDRWFANRTTGQKIMGGLGIFLSGLSLGGGPNQAINMIQNAINRDIDAQKTELAQAGKGVDLKRNALADLTARLGSERAAELAARNIGLTATQMKINALQAKSLGQENQLKLATLNNEIELKKAQNSKAIAKEKLLRVAEGQLDTFTGGAGGMSPQVAQSLRVMDKLDPEQAKLLRETYVKGPGFEGFTRGNKESAKELRKEAADANTALKSVDELMSIGRKVGREFVPSEAKAQAQVLTAMLQGPLRVTLVGPGAVTDAERELIQGVISDPTKVTNVNSLVRLKLLSKKIRDAIQEKAKSEGLNVTPSAGQSERPGPARGPSSVSRGPASASRDVEFGERFEESNGKIEKARVSPAYSPFTEELERAESMEYWNLSPEERKAVDEEFYRKAVDKDIFKNLKRGRR